MRFVYPECKIDPSFVATHTVNIVGINPIAALRLEFLHPLRLNSFDIGQTSRGTEVQPVLVPPVHLVLVGRAFLGLGIVGGSFAAEAVGLEQGGVVPITRLRREKG